MVKGIDVKTKPVSYPFPFCDPELSLAERVADLVSRMTLEEKISQMLHDSPAVERLGIPAYNWWNEGLHGVARAGMATVFPQAIGLAAMWNEKFLFKIADIISTEARAKHHEFQRQGDRNYYTGLTLWSPNINIFRDPRWGRGQETYGECPFLTARLGVAFCKGLQGDNPRYLKVVATPKHYAVHSGPEQERHSFNARVSLKDLRETYLPAFHACVTQGGAASVMGAYNRTNGEVCCGSRLLLQKILREEWGFAGYVVSDCWAIQDFHLTHKVTENAVQSAAHAVKNGCDLNCGCAYQKLMAAIDQGLLTEEDIDRSVKRLMTARIKLGMFDPPERVPYAGTAYEVNDSAQHREASRAAARESMVLLKNDGVLPLAKDIPALAVIGPNAFETEVLLGNYHGMPSRVSTPLDGVRSKVSDRTRVWYAQGCRRTGTAIVHLSPAANISEAVSMVQRSDAVIMVLGLSNELEGEQGDAGNADAGGDRRSLALPGMQSELLKRVVSVGKPVILVVVSGSATDLAWAHDHANAVIQAWYPGPEGGAALADVIFGDYSPAGRLPLTFVRSIDQLPAFTDYRMKNRTYRYLESEPLYPFGYGLSYTKFQYHDLVLSQTTIPAGTSVTVSVTVTNVGNRAGDEVVQLYVRDRVASVPVPHFDLRGFQRVALAAGASARIVLALTPESLSLINEQGERILEPGVFDIFMGGSQPDSRSVALTGQAPLSSELTVTGASLPLPY